MKVTIFDGTPEEILKAFPGLTPAKINPAKNGGIDVIHPNSDDASLRYVSTAVARLVLRRRPLSKGLRVIVEEVYGAYPKMILANDLQKLIGYTRPQFSGLMGAFGRRFTHTKGYVEPSWFFKQEWDSDAKCTRYGFPDTVREAIRLENLV